MVLDAGALEVVEAWVVDGMATFGYVPGLLTCREIPVLLAAQKRLTVAARP